MVYRHVWTWFFLNYAHELFSQYYRSSLYITSHLTGFEERMQNIFVFSYKSGAPCLPAGRYPIMLRVLFGLQNYNIYSNMG